jgi:hypothetical protein
MDAGQRSRRARACRDRLAAGQPQPTNLDGGRQRSPEQGLLDARDLWWIARSAAKASVLRPGQEAGKRLEMAANGFRERGLESVINRQDTVSAMNV